MNKEKKIGIIIFYVGKLPWYFNFFIHSCKYNPTINFFIITDNIYNENLPFNVLIIKKTLEDLNNLATQKLGFKINIKDGYKICDIRPTWGLLFSDILAEFDFWGYGDIDVIYGNIRSFITTNILDDYDVISVRTEYLTGFFTIFKNINKLNLLFENSRDYKFVFQSEKYLGFDECSLLCSSLVEGISIFDLKSHIESMTHVVKKLNSIKKIKSYFDVHVVESVPGKLKWDKGNLIYDNQFEILLYHLITFKSHPLLTIPNWKKIPEKFYIHEYSFS